MSEYWKKSNSNKIRVFESLLWGMRFKNILRKDNVNDFKEFYNTSNLS